MNPSSNLTARLMGMFGLGLSQFLFTGAEAGLQTCSNDTQLSCNNSTTVQNTCCFNTPGGLLLQTQFWDTNPATGPSDSWTIHGLWPDNCDGTYQSNCDKSRAYKNITSILQAQGRTELLDYMDTYWKDENGDDESFYEHEWAKHGTCINTIDPDCYTDYYAQEEVGDFFQKVVDLFKGLNTYQFLSDAGITPSSSQTYDLSDLQDALTKAHGASVTINCEDGTLDEVWYYFNVKGNAISGTYVAADAVSDSTCPDSGIQYLPKDTSSD